MAKRTAGAGRGGQPDDGRSAEHRQSVNERSLLILRLMSRLSQSYPVEADVKGVVDQLSIEDDRAWKWICNLRLVQGEPGHASLTTFGKKALDMASLKAGFSEILEGSSRLREPEDKHASGVLALLHASYELGGADRD